MAYNTGTSFADLLRQAKAQSQLRGAPLNQRDIKSIGQGYFSQALDMTNADRAYNLAEEGQGLAEKSQAASESQFAQSLAQNNRQFAQNLAFQKESEAEQMEAAKKAQMQGMVGTGLQATGMGAYLAGPSGLGWWGAGAGAGAKAAGTAGAAAGLEANAALTGAEATGGFVPAVNGVAGGAGAASSGLLGSSGGVLGSGLGTLGTAGAGIAGYAAPKVLEAIHEDSVENLGHIASLGVVKDEQTAQTVGGSVAGAGSGALAGAALTSWSGPGAIVGAVIGGVIGAISCFVAGTKIDMADGSTKPIEDVDLLEECAEGGAVTGKGVALASDLYDYEGVGVTGSHAVFEDEKWIRVRDGKKSKPILVDGFVKVYILNNVNHVLKINGITFADYGEMDDGMNYTENERILVMNERR